MVCAGEIDQLKFIIVQNEDQLNIDLNQQLEIYDQNISINDYIENFYFEKNCLENENKYDLTLYFLYNKNSDLLLNTENINLNLIILDGNCTNSVVFQSLLYYDNIIYNSQESIEKNQVQVSLNSIQEIYINNVKEEVVFQGISVDTNRGNSFVSFYFQNIFDLQIDQINLQYKKIKMNLYEIYNCQISDFNITNSNYGNLDIFQVSFLKIEGMFIKKCNLFPGENILDINFVKNLQIQNIEFNENQSSKINIKEYTEWKIYSLQSSFISIFQSQNIYFNNTKMLNNQNQYAGTGAIMLQNCENILLENGIYENNYINYGHSAGLMIINSNLIVVQNSYFSKNHNNLYSGSLFFNNNVNIQLINNQIQDSSTDISGGAGVFFFCENLELIGNIFKKNYAYYYGGGINLLYVRNLKIENNIFQENVSENYGASLSLASSSQIYFKSNNITKNKAGLSGGCLHSTNTIYVYFEKNHFFENFSGNNGGVFTIQTGFYYDIIQNQFLYNIVNGGKGAAIAVFQGENISIQYSNFTENQGFENIVFLNNILGTQVVIKNCNFINNHVERYNGALQINGVNFITIQNSIFKQNYGGTIGGVIIYAQGVQFHSSNNTYSFNEVLHQGGAIHIYKVQNFSSINDKILNNQAGENCGGIYLKKIDYIQFTNTTISNNLAYYYGAGIFLEDVNVVNLQKVEIRNNTLKSNDVMNKNYQGGGLYASSGGGIYITNEKVDLHLNIQNVSFDSNQASSGTSILIYQSKDQNILIDKFQNVDIKNDVGDLGLIRYLGKQQDKIKALSFKNQDTVLQENLFLSIHKIAIMTGYITNEQITENYNYKLCSQGSILEKGGEQKCEKCHEHGQCNGGYKLNYPNEGYWRENNMSFDYIQCEQNYKKCLGNDTCAQGYKGVLCSICDYEQEYQIDLNKKCEKCPEMIWNIIVYQLWL
ncbi:Pectin lyase fold/virulence factor [Pseudocohnilembus persalinus]|uniref:Pectin lyase fold/virulence factor n=1 Tax=Pseudocohnilembus persalinus TaxID=266149 RepID=A0A0V0QF66_PSEPJ|nr:Pectin lyase fold/virulence factor [Pseudocohnilembus persalinus]|eukprot:KRX00827.1 Pectin lyase fold/virulence factor [Pseudocohnilembus persalinus]